MNRSDLGKFGAGLPDDQLAQALVALGVLSPHGLSWDPGDVDNIVGNLTGMTKGDVCEVTSWWLPIHGRFYDPAPVLAEGWRRFVTGKARPPRLEVLHDDSFERACWLASQARHPAIGAASVYVRVDDPARPVAWEWPLRLGVLGAKASSTREASLVKALGKVGFHQLWTMVDMDEPGAECELLLLPGDLRQGLADVLNAAQRLRADCVLVLGATEMSAARRLALVTALRREVHTAGVAVMRSGTDVAIFLTELVRELSHNTTLDVALTNAARVTQWATPELLFSHNLAAFSSVRLTAARVAHQFSSERKNLRLDRSTEDLGAPLIESQAAVEGPVLAASKWSNPMVNSLSQTLENMAAFGQWEFEIGEASKLVRIREDIARSTGQLHRSLRLHATPPPQPVDDVDERQVLAQVQENGAEHSTSHLRADTAYRIRVKIAKPEAGFSASGEPFPSNKLPPSEAGHLLDISFVPLSTDASGRRSGPQRQQAFLPPAGESTPADFVFATHGIINSFRARLVVSHENRVLQMLLLDGALATAGDEQPQPYNFTVENIVYPGFQNLSYQAPLDAALIVNHSQRGQPGITALAGSSIAFIEPEGLAGMIEKLQETLTDETALRKTEFGLDAQPLTDMLYALMLHGRLLYDYVESQLGSLDRDAGRLQIVEARAGAFFPVEFLYPMEVPPTKPALCPSALTALRGEASHQRCQHRDDPEYMCPMRFWGFRKQIERQPAGIVPTDRQATVLSVPTALNGKLELFRSVQVARSEKVQSADYDLPKGLLKVLNELFKTVGKPKNWKEWRGGVNKRSPGFLLLLPHTATDAIASLPTLEISTDVLPLASLEASYVKGPEAMAPVVLLLGCSTADPQLGFLNFVERFKRKQASLVIGTLSTISAQRATRFLSVALSIFKRAEGSGRTFGEVFLEVKRVALADGDGFALSLVAYGDMGWQL
jgi:hypothetical protein